jgi:hypothetical protein
MNTNGSESWGLLAELLSAGRITAFVFLGSVFQPDGNSGEGLFSTELQGRNLRKGFGSHGVKESGDARRSQKPLAEGGGRELLR